MSQFNKSQSVDQEILPHNNTTKKKFIGGYKNKFTNTIYHHAMVQTLPSPWKNECILKFHRDSQTVKLSDMAQQTSRNTATQVKARNIFINSSCDKSLEYSGSFESADDIREEYIRKVIVVQKYVRQWLACRELSKRKKLHLYQKLRDEEREHERRKLEENWKMNLEERKINPRTEEDFKLMYSDLQKWWEIEKQSIAMLKSEEDMKSAMSTLVNKEVQRIFDIGKKKTLSIERQEYEFREKSFHLAAQPKLWKGHNTVVHVQTESTHKWKSLKELYNSLCMEYVSPQDRIVILSSLKEWLLPYHCKLSTSLIQLTNREIDLLVRGTKGNRLEGLRNRIRDLFWQFVKKPIYNSSHQKPENKKPDHVLCCSSCKQFFTLKSDAMDEILKKSVLANYFAKCKKCTYIENEAWKRKDFENYKKILKYLIFEEEKTTDVSGLLYVIQPTDIQYLIEKIWKRQSCISGATMEDNLEFIRYNFKRSWTPWNCLLVTKEEAYTLRKTPDPQTKFDEKFKECVAQRHAEAKTYFSNIPRFFPYISNIYLLNTC